MVETINLGVIGYSAQDFNEKKARKIIRNKLSDLQSPNRKVTVVSGLTNLGIPKIAYEEADKKNMKTVGIACEKAEEYDCYPVDEKTIHGEEWGDESEIFLDRTDMLLKVGGGVQSKEELEKFKKQNSEELVFEYNL